MVHVPQFEDLCSNVLILSQVGLEPPQLSVSEERHLAILTELPFVVPFEERVKVLHRCPSHKHTIVPCAVVALQNEGVNYKHSVYALIKKPRGLE